MIIAIDGPAGAGKSSISKAVAERLGFRCLDTGAMYRAVATVAKKNGVAYDDAKALSEIAETYPIGFKYLGESSAPTAVLIGGEDVTRQIRETDMDLAASDVSKLRGVREALVGQQRRIGLAGDYVAEGRDTATVVFPMADVKVFLTATPEARALRRARQNAERGYGETDYETLLSDIIKRDQQDSTRENSPLKVAEDAIVIDSSDMTIDEVVDRICSLAR